jgi:hypothetical protein
MSSLRRKLTITRRPSLLNVPNSSDASAVPHSGISRPCSPSVFSRTSGRIRAFYDGTFNDTTPAFQMLAPPSNSSITFTSAGPPYRPQISPLAKSFTDALDAQQLSDFLIWFLYYDTVELPESPESWYAPLNTTDTSGWIALGTFLSQTQAANVDYGLDLVVLDSICDRLRTHRSIVHEILIRFASPEKMAFGILATTIQRVERSKMAKLPLLVEIQAKLQAMHHLAGCLRPTPDSQFHAWRTMVLKRLKGLLHLVIGPRILHLTDGKPLLMAATCERLSKEVMDGIKLSYLFEVVQLERRVPMARYGLYEDGQSVLRELDMPPSSSLEQVGNNKMVRENHALKEEVARLARNNRALVAVNEDLIAKLNLATSVWAIGSSSTAAYDSSSPITSSPSEGHEETPLSSSAIHALRQSSYDDSSSFLSVSPTSDLSEIQDFDLQLAITLSCSPPPLPPRHPARP